MVTVQIELDSVACAEEVYTSLMNEAHRIEGKCPATSVMLRGVAAQFDHFLGSEPSDEQLDRAW